MTVKDLKDILEGCDDNAKVVVVDFCNGMTRDAVVGSDDDDEGDKYCRISC